jgi:hypothetical protein
MSGDHRIRAFRSALATAVIGALSFAMLTVASPAAADDHVTYGDVVAHFQASEGAGSIIDVLAGPPASELAGPATFFSHGIRPFAGLPWDGSSVCEEDWQLLVFALIVASLEGEPAVSRTDGEALLAPVTVDLYLDGTRLTDTERTPIKRLVLGIAAIDGEIVEVTDGWWVQTGAFRAPGTLAVGTHTFGAVIVVPDVGEFVLDPITFEVDAAGTGSCA